MTPSQEQFARECRARFGAGASRPGNSSVLTGIDLFSGPGGLTLGMKAAGITPVMGVEVNKDAVATYLTHTPESDHRHADIRQIEFGEFEGKVDVVYGGPPCQPFSLGGRRQGQNDERDMVPQFVRAIAQVKPSAFVMENVPGLLSSRYKAYFDWLLTELEEAGFVCSWRILKACDYGVPQNRKRVFIVGMRGREFRFPVPTHGKSPLLPHVASSRILGPDPIGEPAKSPVIYAPIVDLRPNPYHGHIYKGGGRPVDPNAPCQTIYASAGGNKTHWMDTENIVPDYHAHLKRGGASRSGIVPGARRLSVEESAIFQTFPPDLIFQGSRSSQYTQVGDAVPPMLAQAIGEALATQLLGTEMGIAFMPKKPMQRLLPGIR